MSAKYSLENVEELAGGDQEFIAVLVQTFLEEIPPDVSHMMEAVENNNPPEAYQFAHKMKPNLQLFGVDLVSEIKTIEGWSKSGEDKEKILPIVQHISTTIISVVKELEKDFG